MSGENYNSLKEIPANVLAGRIVHSLILAKGNINEWDKILTATITAIREDYKEREPEDE